ncbi:ferritin family protein [Geomonas nitrogeniifigens]|uniref:Ferritin family protein n=1 Tax=Geomonas diazotrophica TaxID=2843197 RepID=A0ABX8JPN4_9BACT|nr:ferritin family protein [Geomonas nitrogeniifigens]QWV99542.1 ferritin family protein [Geomonas nitrogeniifigens]QXE88717.1 ferritin family protein [Geomonas nitrogeniifigens]
MKDTQDALKQAIQTEKNAMNFYQIGAQHMKDTEAKRLFEQLAREEKEHAAQFFKAYRGNDLGSFEEFITAPPQNEALWVTSIQKAIDSDFTEQKALEYAMEKETHLEKALRETAGRITDPGIKEIFLWNANETHNHFLTIEAEYARLMAMVDESDMDTYVRE